MTDTPKPFPADLYTLLHRGEPGDVDFYRRACEGASRVLELGCGAGRVLAGLRAPGRRLVGLDDHEGMLALARQRVEGATFRRGDMRDFALGERFDRVLIPYNGLFALDGPEGVIRALTAARVHLAEGGRVLFDVYAFDPLNGAEEADEDFEHLTSVEHGGVALRISTMEAPIKGGWAVTYRHEGGGAVVEYTLRHKLIAPELWPSLAARAGLRVMDHWGGFKGEPPSPLADFDIFSLAAR
ncbi:class I SAM-dependent methyltransferase [Myxococcota bacterium]|nr:class I SAM-dependent methyltransferase [Myxococcota bacterium]MBU1897145.1 class I SAM-dependent methyltransferase [Myxococcota bacterium]